MLDKLTVCAAFTLFICHACWASYTTGWSIVDIVNITEAIYGSRKTAWVISRHYLENEWCSREIQMASHLRELSPQHSISTAEICKYISELESEFTTRFGEFLNYGRMFSFLIKPDSFDGHELDLSLIDWLDTQDMIMQLIELKSLALWGLRKQLETTAGRDHGTCIFTCWISLPEKFSCLRKIALALLTVFGSTYLCEQIFSHRKSVLSPSQSFDN
ncbi:hypothetical protein NHX12_011212 [Muraenolepis orangiensis]|uniref:TIR domain-containing protein n=1 Tax=Muraenolepis orangiensis TaxID=630683 RepID=A0A9Q0DIH1_9TELE|nr:hypothetical protein NHX12_011212 [Muraenolepis orangiensis]